jgi:hypothetical protein
MGVRLAAVAAALRLPVAGVVLAAGVMATVAGGGGALAGTAGQASGPAGVGAFRPDGLAGLTPAAAGLTSVSCVRPSGCMAVGGGDLAEWWNGTRLRVLPSVGLPQASLNAVSCTSASRCMAVGGDSSEVMYHTLAVAAQWNGRRWRILTARSPHKDDSLDGVSCVSASDCLAVGGDLGFGGSHLFLAERWDGRTWRVLKITTPTGTHGNTFLSGVSCASASMCMAVGHDDVGDADPVPVAESWNGARWRMLPVADPDPGPFDSLNAVSCPRPAHCVAVGSGSVMAETWDGSTWTAIPPAAPAAGGSFESVSCVRPALCLATGTDTSPTAAQPALAEEWNGSTWQLLAAPSPGGGAHLSGVSCIRETACLAVGSYIQNIGGTLAEAWDGKTWRLLRTGKVDDLYGVSCPRPSRCIAVGNYLTSSDTVGTLALARTGRTWRQLAAPGLPASQMYAVSCASPTSCMAVGTYAGTVAEAGLAETWNGSTWMLATTGLTLLPGSVDCPAPADCIAIDGGAQEWNGKTWHSLSPAFPAGTVAGGLDAISCTSPAHCMAVGAYYTDPEGNAFSLAETWNGSTWHILPTPDTNMTGADSVFTSVSCPRPSRCIAVGSLSAAWNGKTWRQLRTPLADSAYLLSVSCATVTACMAVGYLFNPGDHAVAESWNGSKWRVRTIPASSPFLPRVTCTQPSSCLAVGQTDNGRTLAVSWNGTRWRTLTTPDP